MAIYHFSSYSGTSNSVPFNPETDVFTFDSSSISPTAVGFVFTASTAAFSFGGTTVTLNASPLSLTPSNLTFASGGQFLLGDQLISTTGDFSTGKQSSGSASSDVIIGFDGQDSMSGNGGNDFFYLLSSNAISADAVDGGDGTDRVTFFSYNSANGAFLGQVGGINVNLANGTATQGSTTVQLTSIEEVRIAGSNGNTYGMTGSAADDSLIVGGNTGTNTAVYNIDGGAGNDYLA
ncbi:MAG: hypothetical protein J0M01_08020, partial [Dechloromonas sp.]|nr:hypothetical protein [Dechloromonas sp.]